jgi:2-(1,2-epoxy-1,2-dihydrophenyl)acetyl-CoA isomerase
VGTLKLVIDGGVATVTLDRAERMNAIDTTLGRELAAVGTTLAEDPAVGAIVLTGSGRAFCAGADLTPGALPFDALRRGDSIRAALQDLFNPIVRVWALLPKPVVVALNGVAAGGGVGLALCGDFLLMAEDATLVQVFVPRLGLVPDMGTSYLLPRAIGAVRAMESSLLGAPITAAEAVAWGAAHLACPREELLARASGLASRLAAAPAQAMRATKSLQGIDPIALETALEREADAQGTLGDTPDHAEGIAAHFGRRSPEFGRR